MVIGLDAATMDLVEPWAARGELPCLAGLMGEGSSARLLSTPNMHSASAWTSILTGLSPGRHGLFVFSDRDYETGKQVFFKGGDRVGKLIADYLASEGLTSGFLNVPMTYPAECSPEGFVVSGLDSPSLNEKAFCPQELRQQLLERLPDYAFSPPGLGRLMAAGKVDDALKLWQRLTEVQTAAAEYLLSNRPVDFFMTVYTASDWGGHNLWRVRGRGAERGVQYPSQPDNELLQIYRMLDQAIGRLLKLAGNATQVYVISDHGMGPHSGASYHLAGWLERNGFMVRARSAAQGKALNAGTRLLKRALPESLKKTIKSRMSPEQLEQLKSSDKDSFYSAIDWTKTTAYTEPGRHVININIEGRNRNGIVSPANVDKVCQEIITGLREWTDSAGRQVVEHVVRREDSYTGPFAGRASDLYIYWNPEASVGDPPEEVKARGFWWSGDHRPEGILISRGPGIATRAELKSPSVYDLVPTIMHLAELSVPGGLDGRVIEELCTDDFKRRNPIRYTIVESSQQEDAGQFSQSEEALVEEKLRGLGYL
jgi:predicted AlkP superfamily phosphohydrolase/phosphomutase